MMKQLPCPSLLTMLFAALTLMALSSCVEEQTTIPNDAVVVGLLLPFTGADAAVGSPYEAAAQMAVKQINKAGGIDGHPLVVATADTHSDATRAIDSLHTLLKRNAVAIVGPENAEISRALMPIVQERDVPLISPVIQGAVSLVTPGTTSWFRLAPSPTILGRTLANDVISRELKTVSMVYTNDDANIDFVAAFTDRFTSRGGRILSTDHIDSTRASNETIVENLEQADAALLATDLLTAATLVNESSINNENMGQWLLTPAMETTAIIQNTYPGALEGAIGAGIDVLRNDAFDYAYRKQTGMTAPTGAYYYYDAFNLLALALTAVAVDPEKSLTLTDAIHQAALTSGVQIQWDQIDDGLKYVQKQQKVSYPGLTGPFLFDATGQQQKAKTRIWRIEKTEFVNDDL